MRPMRSALRVLVALVFSACFVGLQAQDFQRTYAIPSGGQIRIANISGDIRLTGYKGDSVMVSATKVGRDRDKVEVEDASSGNRVDLKVRYPENGNTDASVNFEVRIPQYVDFVFERIGSISGDVEIADVRGQIKAASVSGDVLVRNVAGIVSAASVSGDVVVEMVRMEGRGEMKFNSVSGDVEVRAPANLDADVDMSTISGSLKTDFPIEVQERRYGPGRSARGRLGAGASSIKINSVSGRVSLLRTSS